MSNVKIRPTIPSDLDALADVLVQVHEMDGYPVEGVDNPRLWLDLGRPIGQWTALIDGAPMGHVALTSPAVGDGAPRLLAARDGVPPDRMAVLVRLFVSPRARGVSVARRLMDAAERAADAKGLLLTLDVMAKDRAAVRLYMDRGWTLVGNFRHEYAGGGVEALALARQDPALRTQ